MRGKTAHRLPLRGAGGERLTALRLGNLGAQVFCALGVARTPPSPPGPLSRQRARGGSALTHARVLGIPAKPAGEGEKRALRALGRAWWSKPGSALLTNGLRRVAVGDESVEEGGCHQGCYDCHDHETGEEFFADDPSF